MGSDRHFAIRLTKSVSHSFTASHLLTFGDSVVEPLHSHTFYVEIYIEGTLDADDCVVDFLTLESILQSLLTIWQDKILLPTQNRYLRIEPITLSEESPSADFSRRNPAGRPLSDSQTAVPCLSASAFRLIHSPANRPEATLHPAIPAEKVVLLPVKNPSAERLAELLATAIEERLQAIGIRSFTQLRVELEEHPNAHGICTLQQTNPRSKSLTTPALDRPTTVNKTGSSVPRS